MSNIQKLIEFLEELVAELKLKETEMKEKPTELPPNTLQIQASEKIGIEDKMGG